MDIAIFLEGEVKPDHTVEVQSLGTSLHQLRKQMKAQCDINFKFSFINLSTRYYIVFFYALCI